MFILCIHDPYTYVGALACMTGFEEPDQQELAPEIEGELHHLEVNVDGVTGGVEGIEELPECPDHVPTSFVQGKPRCMLNLPMLSNFTYVLLICNVHLSLGVM